MGTQSPVSSAVPEAQWDCLITQYSFRDYKLANIAFIAYFPSILGI